MLPGTIGYSEGYVSNLMREWTTGLAPTLGEAELKGAIEGFDVGAGITLFELSLSADVGPGNPLYQTVSYGIVFPELLGIDLPSFGITIALSRFGVDIPFTKGWAKLEEIRGWTRSDFP